MKLLYKLIELLERIAIALEARAGIESPRNSEDIKIERLTSSEEEIYKSEIKENLELIQSKMDSNELKAFWEEDNLSIDDLESLE